MTSTSFRSTRPTAGEFLSYYGTYIDQVPDGDIVQTMAAQNPETLKLIRSLAEADGDKRYAPDKWSIRQIIGHIIDAERIFVYRALRFARADATGVPGFDENSWAANANNTKRKWKDLVEEFITVRAGTELFFESLRDEDLLFSGTANNHPANALALGYVAAGHVKHHLLLIKERYLGKK